MPRSFLAFLARFLVVFAVVAGLAAPALADSLDDAKAAGLLGERADGYLGLVTGDAPSGVVALMKETNRKRRDQYQAIAAKNGTKLEAVEAIVGQKLIGRAAAGTWVRDSSGAWKQK